MTKHKKIDQQFIDNVWSFYDQYKRDLPWRHLSGNVRDRVYQVVVSEVMLQQTQVSRVITKYEDWMRRFPTLHDASEATFVDVLSIWKGLGYNRRAKYLHSTLRTLDSRKDHELLKELEELDGIGSNTAGAIIAYTSNEPSVYIETNIRSSVIHYYFSNATEPVSDRQIIEIIGRVVDKHRPREWYWALMDYGAHIKKNSPNNSKSKSYKKQSSFEGSMRQLRGKVLELLLKSPTTYEKLSQELDDNRLLDVMRDLEREKLIRRTRKVYAIYSDSKLE